jgi:hypothetical protein
LQRSLGYPQISEPVFVALAAVALVGVKLAVGDEVTAVLELADEPELLVELEMKDVVVAPVVTSEVHAL